MSTLPEPTGSPPHTHGSPPAWCSYCDHPCHACLASPRGDPSRLVGGGDPSGAVVELPDDELEAVAQAAVAAVRAGGSVGEVAEALLPELRLLAARVRAEAGNVFTNALTLGARPSQVIIVGARMTEDVLNTVRVVEEAFATAVRAEAVAERGAHWQQRLDDEAGVRLQPGRWWRVIAPDGSLWCETSVESEARERVRAGDTLEREYVGRLSEWRAVR